MRRLARHPASFSNPFRRHGVNSPRNRKRCECETSTSCFTHALRLTIMYDSILSVDMLAAGARCTVTVTAARIYPGLRPTGARAGARSRSVDADWVGRRGRVVYGMRSCAAGYLVSFVSSSPFSVFLVLAFRALCPVMSPPHPRRVRLVARWSHAAPAAPCACLPAVSRLWRRVPARRECASRWTDSSLGGGAAWRFHGAPARSQGVALPECVRRGPSVR